MDEQAECTYKSVESGRKVRTIKLNRTELKNRARALIRRNYWGTVTAGLVMALSGGMIAKSFSTRSFNWENGFHLPAVNGIFFGIAAVLILAVILFVLHPLEYGSTKYFERNIDNQAQGTLFDGFRKENFAHAVSVFFYRNVMIGLYTALLVIPGIIKSYEYYFVSFLAVEYPERSARELCRMSSEMTDGSKKELFLLDLSFLLWQIANTLTLGLVGIFVYFPYKYQTKALAYRCFRENNPALF